ncbi:hypothetical protein [Clostridium sp.]|uniref:hypothetical protein n=1 Tax=Clostridium sp. TaxID=1506 RepID=UPI003990EB12
MFDKNVENLLKHYEAMLELKRRELEELNHENNSMSPIDKSLEAAKISGQSQYIKFFIEDLEKLSK